VIPATPARQIDGPYVAQRNAREKRVDAQGKPFELLASDLRHAGPLAREALLLLRTPRVRVFDRHTSDWRCFMGHWAQRPVLLEVRLE
jgi:hypothetical protein